MTVSELLLERSAPDNPGVVMSVATADPLALLSQAADVTAAGLRRTHDPGEQAVALAEGLRALWPPAPLHAARLSTAGREYIRVRDANGQAVPTAPGADFPPTPPTGLRWVL